METAGGRVALTTLSVHEEQRGVGSFLSTQARSQGQGGTLLQKGHRQRDSRKFCSTLDGVPTGSKMKK